MVEMKEGLRMVTLKAARALLDEKGLRSSATRIHVLAYLLSYPSHPTADEIYQALLPKMLTLSKTTIYNTLDLLTEANITRQITIDGKEARFDIIIVDHGHFQCNTCKHIYDFSVDLDECMVADLTGFKVAQRNIYFKGICPNCQK
ncbi:MAG: transcriptional repressor [Firmicutes bacterium]|nr:transcriptional repressor [Bacillota bacterium]